MIEAKLAVTDNDIESVFAAMPTQGSKNVLCIYGYWDNNKCVGGAYLLNNYPYEFVYEYNAKFENIVDALKKSTNEMLNVKNQLIARVLKSNYKSLKRLKTIGFVKLYFDDENVVFQYSHKNIV